MELGNSVCDRTCVFTSLFFSFKIAKARKRQQRLEKQQAKEAEHVARQKAVAYTLRVTDMLNNVGDEDKENFRSGSEGATVRLEILGEMGHVHHRDFGIT